MNISSHSLVVRIFGLQPKDARCDSGWEHLKTLDKYIEIVIIYEYFHNILMRG
jgi:hypothetical protein